MRSREADTSEHHIQLGHALDLGQIALCATVENVMFGDLQHDQDDAELIRVRSRQTKFVRTLEFVTRCGFMENL